MLHNYLMFGDVPVGVSRQVSFTLTSRSNTTVYRFEAPHHEGLVFSPSRGHLHPGASKEITVTLRSDRRLVMKEEALDLQLCKITFAQPLSQVQAICVRLVAALAGQRFLCLTPCLGVLVVRCGPAMLAAAGPRLG